MTDASTALMPDDLGAPPARAPGDVHWSRPVLERQLAMVERLAEVGMQIAEALGRQATEASSGTASGAGADDGQPAEPLVARGDLSLAYARVSRAVRLTILLQSKLIEDLCRLDRGAACDIRRAEIDRNAERPRLVARRKAHLQRIVARIAHAEGEDHDGIRRLMTDAVERVEQDELYGDLLSRPFSEIVAQLCRDMGLSPDWPRVAQEAWARAEMQGAAPGSPLAALMAQGLDAHPDLGPSDLRPSARKPDSRPAAEPISFRPHAASP